MAAPLDLERLARLFTRRGERVVVVLPSGDPVVLLSLPEYEKLTSRGAPTVIEPPRDKRGSGRPAPPSAPATPSSSVEAVDPPQGGMADDDQYYPEPLEG